eukprot:NODE_143_length_2380_cov_144.801802_g124_i0.p1 GENE.NODE_143_length_2380_cov_144.801802_g124_i0~~NODE_143_length_2380_cov_144.801802_g124_i0.p1  ORF type:complete len:740 (-),score=177.82 NODE_143_length_2380_cov_144.801802_g124_i0:160-2355(-)
MGCDRRFEDVSQMTSRVSTTSLPMYLKQLDSYELRLKPLSRVELTQMCCKLLGVTGIGSVSSVVHDKSDGNPGLAEQILRSMQDSDCLVVRNGQATLSSNAQVAELAVFANFTQVLTSRVDRLSTLQNQLMKTASVIGRRFHVHLLASCLDLSAAVVSTELRHLVTENYLYSVHTSRRSQHQSHPAASLPTCSFATNSAIPNLSLCSTDSHNMMDGDDSEHYAFVLNSVRDTLYSMLLFRERREMHARVARILQREGDLDSMNLAYHFSMAEMAHDAVECWEQAVRAAFRKHQFQKMRDCLVEANNISRGTDVARSPRVPYWHTVTCHELGDEEGLHSYARRALPNAIVRSNFSARAIVARLRLRRLVRRQVHIMRPTEDMCAQADVLAMLSEHYFQCGESWAFLATAMRGAELARTFDSRHDHRGCLAHCEGWLLIACLCLRPAWVSQQLLRLQNVKTSTPMALLHRSHLMGWHLLSSNAANLDEVMASDLSSVKWPCRASMGMECVLVLHKSLGGHLSEALHNIQTCSGDQVSGMDHNLELLSILIRCYWMGNVLAALELRHLRFHSTDTIYGLLSASILCWATLYSGDLGKACDTACGLAPAALRIEVPSLLLALSHCMLIEVLFTAVVTNPGCRRHLRRLLDALQKCGRRWPVLRPMAELWEGDWAFDQGKPQAARGHWLTSEQDAKLLRLPFYEAQAKLHRARHGKQMAFLVQEAQEILESMKARE